MLIMPRFAVQKKTHKCNTGLVRDTLAQRTEDVAPKVRKPIPGFESAQVMQEKLTDQLRDLEPHLRHTPRVAAHDLWVPEDRSQQVEDDAEHILPFLLVLKFAI